MTDNEQKTPGQPRSQAAQVKPLVQQRFLIRQTVVAELAFDTLAQAIAWVQEHTVFDLLDRNATCYGAQIMDLDTNDMLYDGDA